MCPISIATVTINQVKSINCNNILEIVKKCLISSFLPFYCKCLCGNELCWVLVFCHLYRLGRDYCWKLFSWIRVFSLVFPFLIIPFRFATLWCGSTGVGLCGTPLTLPNSDQVNHTTVDISLPCIIASSVQWWMASFAFLFNALRIFQYITVWKWVCGFL